MSSEQSIFGGAIHWGSGGSPLTIRLRTARIHRITPTGAITVTIDDDDLDTVLREDVPPVWGILVNDGATHTITVDGKSASGDQGIFLPPGTAMLWRLTGQASGQGIYKRGWSRTVNTPATAGYDSGRGALNEAATSSGSSGYCAVYELIDCAGVEDTLYSVLNLNIYVNRMVLIDEYPDVCWRVRRVDWDNQSPLEATLTVNTVHMSCAVCQEKLVADTFDCDTCVNYECVDGVLVVCDDTTSLCDCNGDGLLWYDGGLRDQAYFQSTYSAGAYCKADQEVWFTFCENCNSTCKRCAWCFENARFEEEAAPDAEEGCLAWCYRCGFVICGSGA